MLGENSAIVKYWDSDDNEFPFQMDNKTSWVFKVFRWNHRGADLVNVRDAKQRYRKTHAWYAMENQWPKKFPRVWGWAAKYE